MLKPLLALFAGASCLLAADLSGIWTGQLPDRNGELHDLAFQFTQKGDSLLGKMYGDNESTPISDGKIAGEQVTFTTKAEMNGQHTTFIYTGTVTAGEIRVTRERVDLKDPSAAKDPDKKPDPKPVLALKRLI